MKINIKILAILVSLTLFFTACQELEMEKDTGITDELVWNNPTYIDNYMVDLISLMPNGFNPEELGQGLLYSNVTDESESSNPIGAIQNMNSGNWNSTSGVEKTWNRYYSGIYKVNLFLDQVKNVKYETFESAARALYLKRLEYYKSEARFLRSLYYYELIKRYGGVVLVGNSVAKNIDQLDNTEFKKGRSSFTECADYIIAECNALIDSKALPLLDDGADQGRPNGTAVKALKCKTLVLLASPVYNKNVTEGSAAQMNYWKTIATIAQEIALDRIFCFGPYDKYDGTSPEVILGYRQKNLNFLETVNYPVGCEGVNRTGSTNPSQNLIDAYRMLNGKKTDEAGSGYDPKNPYDGRDKRLLQTAIVNNSDWKERNVQARKIEIFRGGLDGMDRDNGTRTGYYLRKFINPTLDLRQGQSSNREWPIFRFADIILIWAEAVNELYGPATLGTSYLTATTILNQTIVRHGGLPELPLSGISKEQLRERIKEERFIELAFEDQRAWDLRRWGLAKSVLNQPIYKMEVTKNADGTFNYQKIKLEDRYFDDRMNLYPIPQRDVNNGLTQNSGW
ncbi:MAG: RagB/SusD family nutrient uptake outer membrane protein [Prolixibacteraceae bacterium]|nr:RagB/SusD family nutrient uptake outer membrane protein [Prolixibacteraceae bacterium]